MCYMCGILLNKMQYHTKHTFCKHIHTNIHVHINIHNHHQCITFIIFASL